MAELLIPLALIFVVSSTLLVVAKRIGIPSIPVYIGSGLLIAPFIERGLTLDLAQFGIIFLVFVFGVYVEPDRIRSVARDSEHVAALQLLVVGLTAASLAVLIGSTPLDGLYVGIAAAVSSSLVGRKLLDADSRHDLVQGRLTQSIHFIQGLFAVVFVLLLSAETVTADGIALELGYGVIVLLGAMLVRAYLFDLLVSASKGNDELIALTGIGLLVVSIGGAELLNVSPVVGAFAAGVAIKLDFDENLALLNALESLESFFGAIFFVTLGSLVTPPTVDTVLFALVIVGCVVLLRPIVTILVLLRQGYETRTACLTSFGLDQVSEFALIIAIQALILGRIGVRVFDAIVLAAAVTMITATLTRQYDERLFEWIAGRQPFRSTHEKVREQSAVDPELADHIVIIGYGTLGRHIAQTCDRLGLSFVVVDHNPEQFEQIRYECENYVFGDAIADESFEIARAAEARAILSTSSDSRVSTALLSADVDAEIILPADTDTEATSLAEAGAEHVFIPDELTTTALLDTLEKLLSGEMTAEQLQNAERHSLRNSD